MSDHKHTPGYASSPCFAHELELGENGYVAVDEETARDVARWRKAERKRLIDARLALPVSERERCGEEVAAELDRLIDLRPGTIIGTYWPFRAELDLRAWMASVVERGGRIGLPLVIAKGQPLVFREWHPHCEMERGIWNILQPAEDRRVVPDVLVVPFVGYDTEGYRLGYGGGFYDRTIASMTPRPTAIGIAHPVAAIRTIYPQPHDIPMDAIVTGAGHASLRPGASADALARLRPDAGQAAGAPS